MPRVSTKREIMLNLERRMLINLLHRCMGNISLVSKFSGMNRSTVYRMIKKHGLQRGVDYPAVFRITKA